MNKIVKSDSANLTVLKGAQDLADFDRFAKETEKLAKVRRKLHQVTEPLREMNSTTDEMERVIKEAKAALERYSCDGTLERVKRLEGQAAKLEPGEYYTEDGEMSASFGMAMLINFLTAFPTSNVPDPPLFLKILSEEVGARAPNWFALNAALLHLRRTSKFVPTLSELLETLDREEKVWSHRLEAHDELGYELSELPTLIEEAEAWVVEKRERMESERLERERLERDRERQRALPITPGDRVEVEYLGPGTVVRPWGDDLMLVAFDRLDYEQCMDISCLKRLLPGDVNFEQVRA
ncbi:hypothetical protein G5V57_23255 [Nordella sp. HKS 07]|uniref:hypothetical protein n=1 Tax=Nordella sp. HKS 07 TaxID=2712222 RepID=UPI0013E17359|nr:hypothetical protein [Nordella sp. HKS 07]QIG50390.1 hypothetical protein G5V57_23255 [Nordella sp. HKS 07]